MSEERVLDGLRVVADTTTDAGRLAGLLLAELGADVAHLEAGEPGVEPRDWLLRRSQSSVVADPTLRDSLVRVADAVIVDHTGGLDQETAHQLNPGVAFVGVLPYGSAGEFATLPGDSQLAAALSGHTGSQWAAHRQGGVWSYPDFGSNLAGLFAAIGAVAGTLGRVRDGHARAAETSLLAGWMAARSIHAVTGVGVTSVSVADPQGGLSPTMRVYRAGDGQWLLISCSTPQFWGKLCIALDVPELIADPRFEEAPMGVPTEHKVALIAFLQERFSTRSRDAWIEQLRSLDVPCAPVQSPDDAMREPQLLTNGSLVDVEQPGLGATRQLGPLLRFATMTTDVRPAPAVGADTDDVRRRWDQFVPPQAVGVGGGLPLAGVKVLEICNWVAGPQTGALLRQLGAEVWKLESLTGDSVRNMVYVYRPINAGKDVLRINIAHPDGRAVFHDLIGAADVVLHNNRPSLAVELGFDAPSVHAVNPSVVYHEISSYGRFGPLVGDPAFDQVVPARAGIMWQQGGMSAGNPPVLHNGSQGDLPAAYLACLAVCAGLLRQSKSHANGSESWSALLEAGYFLDHAEAILYDDRPARPEGGVDFLGPDPTRRLYATADDWLLLACRNEGDWDLVRELLDIDLPDHAAAAAESVEGPTGTAVAARLAMRTSQEWETGAVAVGLPMVRPRRDREVVLQNYVIANGLDAHVLSDAGHDVGFPGYFVRFAGQAHEGILSPPDFEIGGRRVLAAVGRTDEEIDDLIDRGVVAAARS